MPINNIKRKHALTIRMHRDHLNARTHTANISIIFSNNNFILLMAFHDKNIIWFWNFIVCAMEVIGCNESVRLDLVLEVCTSNDNFLLSNELYVDWPVASGHHRSLMPNA